MRSMKVRIVVTMLIGLAFLITPSLSYHGPSDLETPTDDPSTIPSCTIFDPPTSIPGTGNLGCYFIENLGQVSEPGILYYAQGGDLMVCFGPDGVVYLFEDGMGGHDRFEAVFDGCVPTAPEALDPKETLNNFFLGSSEDGWLTGARSYGRLVYRDLWSGVDVVFRFEDDTLKYDVIVHPGADSSLFSVRYLGVDRITVDGDSGALQVRTAARVFRDDAPYSYQETCEGRVSVPSRYSVLDATRCSFEMGPYDTSTTLVIDPGFVFCTFLGGDKGESCTDMEVDDQENIYLTGSTRSSNFPTTNGAYDTRYDDQGDIFVTKVKADGSGLVWSTFIGGEDSDSASDLFVDQSGNVYLVGSSSSTDFPVTSGSWDEKNNYRSDGYALKLSSDGSELVYSSMMGGFFGDSTRCIYVDGSGYAYIAGNTACDDFPTTEGAYDRTYTSQYGSADVFVAKLNPTGTDAVFSTYLGHRDGEAPVGIAADSSGCVYVVGLTAGPFPTTPGAYCRTYRYDYDMFITKFNHNGSALVYSTLVSTDGRDYPSAMHLEPTGEVWVVGYTSNASFPSTPDAFDRTFCNRTDAVVLRLDRNGTSIEYSTFLGGEGDDRGIDFGWDSKGRLCVIGTTRSTDFPVSPYALKTKVNVTWQAWSDGFLTVLNKTGDGIDYSTLFGGFGDDRPSRLQFVSNNMVLICGGTECSDFPVTDNAYDTTFKEYEGFLAMGDLERPVIVDYSHDPFATTGDPFRVWLNATDNHAVEMVELFYWDTNRSRPQNASSELVSGQESDGTWEAEALAPSNRTGNLTFYLLVKDHFGHTISTEEMTVPIYDNDPPTLMDLTTGEPTTGDNFNLVMEAVDNIDVAGATLEYWYGATASNTFDVPMNPLTIDRWGNGTYIASIRIPINTDSVLKYRFHANDSSSNQVISFVFTLDILDDDKPVLSSFQIPDDGTTGTPFTVGVTVHDNIAPTSVKLTYWTGLDGTRRTVVMEQVNVDPLGNGSYRFQVPVSRTSVEPVNLKFEAVDKATNINHSATFTVAISDGEAPTLSIPQILGPATTGEMVQVSIDANDNIGIAAVTMTRSFGDGEDWTFSMGAISTNDKGIGTYSMMIDLPLRSAMDIVFSVAALDAAGNEVTTKKYTINVTDNDPPLISFDHESPVDLVKGLPHKFDVVAEDNVGVSEVHLKYYYGSGSEYDVMVERREDDTFTLDFIVPRDADGRMSFYFFAMDEEGNLAQTDVFHWMMVNLAPSLSALEPWIVTEGTNSILDLTSFISDPNDEMESLSLACSDLRVAVTGLTLELLLDVWEEVFTITLSLTDGEDTTQGDLQVVVQNINDPPMILDVMPRDGALFSEGEMIDLRADASDEDGDGLTFVWKLGNEVLGEGRVVSSIILEPGNHTITLEVGDGTDVVTQSTTVSVEGGEDGDDGDGTTESESPGFTLVPMLMALALMLLAFRRRVTGTRP